MAFKGEETEALRTAASAFLYSTNGDRCRCSSRRSSGSERVAVYVRKKDGRGCVWWDACELVELKLGFQRGTCAFMHPNARR